VGPGQPYSDIPPAIAAASPGDTILVDPGSYSPFNVSKTLTIASSAAARYSILPQQGVPSIRIHDLGETDFASIMDWKVLDFPGDASALQIEHCSGPVFVKNGMVNIIADPQFDLFPTVIFVNTCSKVSMQGVTAYAPAGVVGIYGATSNGMWAVTAYESTLSFQDCLFRGFDCPGSIAGHGLYSMASRIWETGGTYIGGDAPGGLGGNGVTQLDLGSEMRIGNTLMIGGSPGGKQFINLANPMIWPIAPLSPPIELEVPDRVALKDNILIQCFSLFFGRDAYILFAGLEPDLVETAGAWTEGLPLLLSAKDSILVTQGQNLPPDQWITLVNGTVPDDPMLVGLSLFWQLAATPLGWEPFIWSESGHTLVH
jgi:hypothetical protein